MTNSPKMNSEKPEDGLILSIVIPCYNEEKNIHEIIRQIHTHCSEYKYEIIFIDDCSEDETLKIIEEEHKKNKNIRYVSFMRNAGHQVALRAGLKEVRGKYTVTMDGDLQHPPSYIPAMLALAEQGNDVVNLVREGSQTGFLKNVFSNFFYKFFNNISNFPITPHSSDFRLISKNVVNVLNALPERNLVLRTVIPYLGFKSGHLNFKVGKRFAGSHSYTFFKSFNLASDSILNFTTFPLDLGFKIGWIISMLAFIYGLVAIYHRLFTEDYTPGYTDIVTSILFLGGLILIYVGVLGKYISIIVEQLKERPEYLEKKKSD